MQTPFIVHELPPLLFLKDFNHNALLCDASNDFNLYKYISYLKEETICIWNVKLKIIRYFKKVEKKT